jgi:hypoxanthine phosphoribosyltransferase
MNGIISPSWNDIEAACLDLAYQIRHVNFKPDVILPVLWGGIVPARLLMDILGWDRENCLPVIARSYQYNLPQKEISVTLPDVLPLNDPESANEILIIEEIIDSGRTMVTIMQELIMSYPSIPLPHIRVATLFCRQGIWKPGSVLNPDVVFKHRMIDREWVVFPWDKQEHLKGQE